MSSESAWIKLIVAMKSAQIMVELLATHHKIRCTRIPAILKMQFMSMEVIPAARQLAAEQRYLRNYIITRLIPSL